MTRWWNLDMNWTEADVGVVVIVATLVCAAAALALQVLEKRISRKIDGGEYN